MRNSRDEISQYLELWDQAQKQFPKEKKPVRKNTSSFFGMQDTNASDNFSEDEEMHWRDIYHRSLEIDPDEIMGQGELALNEEEIDQQCLAGMMDIREAREAKRRIAEAKNNKSASKKKTIRTKDEVGAYDEDDVRMPKKGTPKSNKKKDGFGKDLAKKLGDARFTPNPVHFASIGTDQDLKVTPDFSDGDNLRELTRLKALLYDLESELLGKDVRGDEGGDVKSLQKKMMAIRQQCEELSDKLIPDPRYDVS